MIKKLPSPRSVVPELEPVIRAWSLAMDQHQLNLSASDWQIQNAEALLGRRIPRAIRAVYEMSNGAHLIGGNLILDKLTGDSESIAFANNATLLRQWGWQVPNEVFVFGGDGSESVFGCWLPKAAENPDDAPIIQIAGPNSNMDYMAVAATSFVALAKWRTAYYLLMDHPKYAAALEVLGLPKNLQNDDPDDDTLIEIGKWADPEHPHFPPDAYKAQVSVQWTRDNFGAGE